MESFCEKSTQFKFLMLLILYCVKLQKSSYYANDNRYEECRRPYHCGNVSLSYPFYDSVNRPLHCGYPGFHIDCNHHTPKISISSGMHYLVGQDSTSHIIYVAKQTYLHDSCLQIFSNTSINSTLYKYTKVDENITVFYDCTSSYKKSANEYEYKCDSKSSNNTVYYFMTRNQESSQAVHLCKSRVLVPIASYFYWSIASLFNLTDVFCYAFELEWIAENDLCDGCMKSGGECGYDTKISKFACYCPDKPYDSTCSSSNGKGSNLHKIYRIAGIITGCIIIGLVMLALPVAFYFMRRHSADNKDIDAFLKKHGSLPTKRYTYNSLKKITNSFSDKLGEGGFGIVYKGKLPNDQPVAVKLLKEAQGSAEEFINEVTSIGRTNHVNVVTLLGFCFEGQRRGLLYDFMPNGSLEKFIYANNSSSRSLDLDELFKIAVGIARGLEYLHRGCNTRIVHFDIKPHNILLDESFCPKISDFGLAKPLQKNASTIIDMSGARGSVGFIAPEVYLNGFADVSHKSDVYSYGMMVLDMVGCRKSVGAQVDDSSEQYFPGWIYNQLEKTDQDLLSDGKEKESTTTTLQKMVIVSLWCIQTNPSRRPQMSRVVEMLEGSVEAIQIPVIPSLFTPPTSQPTSSNTDAHISICETGTN